VTINIESSTPYYSFIDIIKNSLCCGKKKRNHQVVDTSANFKDFTGEKERLAKEMDVTEMMLTIKKLKFAVNDLSKNLAICMKREFNLLSC